MFDMLVHWLIGKWLLEWRRLHSIGYVHCAAIVWYWCRKDSGKERAFCFAGPESQIIVI